MKKRINVLAALLVIGLLSGCGNKETSEGEAAQENTAGTTTTETQATGEEVSLRDLNLDDYLTLGEYKGLKVSVTSPAADDEEVETWALQLYNSAMTAEQGGIVDRPVEMGDTVNIDYEGKRDGVAFDGGTAQGASLEIGSHQFIDGFEDGLIGVNPGETVDLNLSFPDPYYNNPDLAGVEVVFTVTVNFIMPTEMTNDDVVKNIGIEDVNTVDELRSFLRNYIEEQNKQSYDQELENAVLTELMNVCEFSSMPDEVYKQHYDMVCEDVEAEAASYAEQMGTEMTADEYVSQMYGSESVDALVSNYVENYLKQVMALQAIANKENLNVSDEELEQKLQEFATQYGYETVDELIGENSREDYRDYFMNMNVLEFLKTNAVVEEK